MGRQIVLSHYSGPIPENLDSNGILYKHSNQCISRCVSRYCHAASRLPATGNSPHTAPRSRHTESRSRHATSRCITPHHATSGCTNITSVSHCISHSLHHACCLSRSHHHVESTTSHCISRSRHAASRCIMLHITLASRRITPHHAAYHARVQAASR